MAGGSLTNEDFRKLISKPSPPQEVRNPPVRDHRGAPGGHHAAGGWGHQDRQQQQGGLPAWGAHGPVGHGPVGHGSQWPPQQVQRPPYPDPPPPYPGRGGGPEHYPGRGGPEVFAGRGGAEPPSYPGQPGTPIGLGGNQFGGHGPGQGPHAPSHHGVPPYGQAHHPSMHGAGRGVPPGPGAIPGPPPIRPGEAPPPYPRVLDPSIPPPPYPQGNVPPQQQNFQQQQQQQPQAQQQQQQQHPQQQIPQSQHPQQQHFQHPNAPQQQQPLPHQPQQVQQQQPQQHQQQQQQHQHQPSLQPPQQQPQQHALGVPAVAKPVASAPARPPIHFGSAPVRAGEEPMTHLKTGAPYGPIVKGQRCWYREKEGAWVEAEVVAVDQSVSPPSYAVKINGATRETERERLSVLRPPPEGEAPLEWTTNPPTDRPANQEAQVEWVAYTDTDGSEYYHNAKTGETTWEMPAVLAKKKVVPPPPPKTAAPVVKDEDKYDLPPGVSAVTKVEGTPWCEARLEDGSGSYFFNSTSGETKWEVPPEVEKARASNAGGKDDEERKPKAADTAQPPLTPTGLQQQQQQLLGHMQQFMMMRAPGMPPVPLGFPGAHGMPLQFPFAPPGMIPPGMAPPGMMPPKAPAPSPAPPPPAPAPAPVVDPEKLKAEKEAKEEEERKERERRRIQEENEREKARIEAEKAKVEAEKKRQEDCLHQFKLLLLEKGVTPGGTWEKELPKFCFDPRYKELLANPAERKAAFESFTRADVVKYKEEARRLQAERRNAALEAAKVMLENSSNLTATTTLEDWWKEREGDTKLAGVSKSDKKLRQMFDEATEPLVIAAKEEAVLRQAAQRIKFKELLEGDASLSSSSSWSKFKKNLEKQMKRMDEDGEDDKSDGEIDGGMEKIDLEVLNWSAREEIFREYIKDLDVGEGKDKDSEKERDRDNKDRSGHTKDKDRERERDRDRDRDRDREREREKDRGRDVGGRGRDGGGRDRDSRNERDADSRKRRAEGGDGDKHKRRKGNALEDFKAMLIEHVSDPCSTWSEAREKLRQDDRYDHCADELSSKEREKLCYEHTDKLRDDTLARMLDALNGIEAIKFDTTWEDAWNKLSEVDGRFKLLRSKDREKAFAKWVETKVFAEQEVLKLALVDIPEVVLQADPKEPDRIPAAIESLEQWNKMSAIPAARNSVLWEVVDSLLASKGKSRKALEDRMADSSKDAKRSKANLLSVSKDK